MSYLVTCTYLEEVDIASGYYANGTPKVLLQRKQGATFTPQAGNSAQVTRWQNAGLVQPTASLPTVTGVAPAHAQYHAPVVVSGTALNQATSVTFRLTGAAAGVPETPCQLRIITATALTCVVPKLPPGAYTISAWWGSYLLGTTTFTIDP